MAITANVSNWAGESSSSTGQGSVSLTGALPGYASFAPLNGTDVWYTIVNGLNKEAGRGAYANGTLTRDTVHATLIGSTYTAGGSPITLVGDSQVYCTLNATAFNELSSLDSDLSGLALAVQQNANDIADHESRLSSAETTITDHETRISDNTTAIGNNATAISDNATAIGDNATAIGNNATAISNLDSRVEINEFNLLNHEGRISTNEGDIADLESEKLTYGVNEPFQWVRYTVSGTTTAVILRCAGGLPSAGSVQLVGTRPGAHDALLLDYSIAYQNGPYLSVSHVSRFGLGIFQAVYLKYDVGDTYADMDIVVELKTTDAADIEVCYVGRKGCEVFDTHTTPPGGPPNFLYADLDNLKQDPRNTYVRVNSDGVAEVGQYLDMHVNAADNDFDIRLQVISGERLGLSDSMASWEMQRCKLLWSGWNSTTVNGIVVPDGLRLGDEFLIEGASGYNYTYTVGIRNTDAGAIHMGPRTVPSSGAEARVYVVPVSNGGNTVNVTLESGNIGRVYLRRGNSHLAT